MPTDTRQDEHLLEVLPLIRLLLRDMPIIHGRLHWHEQVELIAVLSGTIDALVHGDSLQLQSGDCLFINSLRLHQVSATTNCTRLFVMQLQPQLLGDDVAVRLAADYWVAAAAEPPTQRLYALATRHMDRGFWVNARNKDLFWDWESESDLAIRLRVQANVLETLAEVVPHVCARQGGEVGCQAKPRVIPAELLSVMRMANTREGYSMELDEAARLSHMSKSHFCRLFRRIFNCTFSQYINRVKVDAADILLQDTTLSISQIAGKAGYNSASYFDRQYKRIRGWTPQEFRRHQQEQAGGAVQQP